MPKKTQSPHQSPTNQYKQHAEEYNHGRQAPSPSNYQPNQLQVESAYHQSTPSPTHNKPKQTNNNSKRQYSNHPPKYSSNKGSSDNNSSNQRHPITRIREQNIDIPPNNDSRHKQKLSPSKYPPQNTKGSKQVGKLMTQLNTSRQEEEEQLSANTPQERKIRDLHANMEKLSQSLLDLRENYQHLEKQEIKYNLKNSHIQHNHNYKIDHNKNNYPSNSQLQSPQLRASRNSEQALSKSKVAPKTNQEVLKFLLQKQREKEERKQKMAIISQQNRKKLQQELIKRNKEQEQYLNWRKSQIRAAHNFQDKHKREKEIEQNRKKAAEQYSKQIKDKKYSYLIKKQLLQQQAQKEFEEKREKVVSQRKQMCRPLDQQEIQEHQKWFNAKRQELIEQRRMLRQDNLQKIEQDNSSMPQFWKGSAHQIAEEQRNRVKQKLKQPYQKAQKIKEYKEYIQQKFKPKSPKVVQPNSINLFDPSKFRQIKRYRYYKGVSYGQIAQTAPVAKDAKQIIRIGNSNMQIMKKIPKKRNNSSSQIYSYTPQPQRKFDLNLVRNIFSSVVQKQKAKQTKITLPQNMKCHQLQAVVDKIRSQSVMLYDKQKYLSREGNKNGRNQQEQRELLDGLVNNIELKLNLLSQL